MKRFVLMALLAGAVPIGGCVSTPTRAVQDVRVVGAGMVQGCQFLGTVSGTSELTGVLQTKGIRSAKDRAKAQAVKWGADTVVWSDLDQSYWSNEHVKGQAYRCNGVHSSAGY